MLRCLPVYMGNEKRNYCKSYFYEGRCYVAVLAYNYAKIFTQTYTKTYEQQNYKIRMKLQNRASINNSVD